jgi:hypothetical protein
MEATFVKDLQDFTGQAGLYRLSSKVHLDRFDDQGFDHVVVSSVVAYSGPETLIFPADEYGILDWLELAGSYRGGLDHLQALEGFLASQG